VRSGVKKIRVIDFDRITLSSLNRHAFATREDVGIAKVACCQKFVKKVLPHIQIEFVETFLDAKNMEKLLEGNPTYVIDCIDNIEAKVDLVAHCVKNKIKIIAACGAGMKADPTQIQIRDISESACIKSFLYIEN
jgi:tRNA A37 threonylcarbamoyladenosine dehydratase